MGNARTSIDPSRIANAVSRPGIDPRVWLSLAVITDLACDEEHGIYADVTLIPTGETETCFLGGPYAGQGWGASFPLAVDDTVLVAMPSGDPNSGPIIIAAMYSSGTKPPADAHAGGMDLSNDVIIAVRPSQKILVTTSDGGDAIIEAKDDGKVLVGTREADEPFVRGNDYADAESSFLDSLKTYIDAMSAGAGAPPNAALPVAQALAAAQAFAPAIANFKNARNTYLSTKVMGE